MLCMLPQQRGAQKAEVAEVKAEVAHVNSDIGKTQDAIEAIRREHGAVFEQFVRATHSGLWGKDFLEGLHLKTVGDVLAYLHIEPADQGQAEGVYFGVGCKPNRIILNEN